MGQSARHLGAWAAITIVTLFIAIGAGGINWLIPLAWLVISFAGYYVSCRVHPRRGCWACKGSGKHVGMIFDYANRACDSCGGSGRQKRLGTRVFKFKVDKP